MRQKLLRLIGVGSETHRQTYYAWRSFPKAIVNTSLVFFNLGFALATLIAVLLR